MGRGRLSDLNRRSAIWSRLFLHQSGRKSALENIVKGQSHKRRKRRSKRKADPGRMIQRRAESRRKRSVFSAGTWCSPGELVASRVCLSGLLRPVAEAGDQRSGCRRCEDVVPSFPFIR